MRSGARQLNQQHHRGRLASAPSEIPARGWKDILLRVWKNIGEDRVMLVAAGVTYYCLLAIFPGIAALVAIYGFFTDPATISAQVDTVSGILPSGALDVFRQQMNQVASQGPTKLGIAFIIGFVVSLWSANAGIKSIFDALNLVYDEPEKRSLVKLNLVSLAFTVAAILFILIAIGCIAALPAVSAMAVDYRGERLRGNRMDRHVDWLFMVRRQLRQLQQDLWIAGRSCRPHVLAMALGCNHPDRRRAGCRNGASDGAGYNSWPGQADGSARRHDGGYYRRGTKLTVMLGLPGRRPEWVAVDGYRVID
jgi:hypothetical protein